MTDREKLIEILRKPIFPHELADPVEAVADYLLDNGVTVQEWISVKDKLPEVVKCKYEGTGIWDGRCTGTKEVDPCPGYDKCKQYKPDYITNADCIRAMSDEELADFFHRQIGCGVDFVPCGVVCFGEKDCPCYTTEDCKEKIAEWLRQPADTKEE